MPGRKELKTSKLPSRAKRGLPQAKNGQKKLHLVPDRPAPGQPRHLIAQLRLARIAQIQADLADLKIELYEEWQSLRQDLFDGAQIEPGPMRAFINYSLRLVRNNATRKRSWKLFRTLVVR